MDIAFSIRDDPEPPSRRLASADVERTGDTRVCRPLESLALQVAMQQQSLAPLKS